VKVVGQLVAARALAALSAAAERSAEDSAGLVSVAEVLAAVVDRRDVSDAFHSRFVAKLCRQIALEMGCDPHQARIIGVAGRLHDIGKVTVPAEILQRPGPLTPAEWELIRRHPVTGEQIVARISVLAPTLTAIRGHHERFDGTGYPDGLVGTAIPLGARIIAAADAYSAMISDRPYRLRRTAREAQREMYLCAESHFDPAALDALVRVVPRAGTDLLAA
jgi:HD-GYP domain-containing protein (c-di-GMP phosphodiesterase class II)